MEPVQDFYKGKNIFITGATGFMGKVLVAKLLKSCPGIGNIYLLIRDKGGLTAKKRYDAYFDSPIFGDTCMPYKNVKLMAGDTLKVDLGLETQDISTLIQKCHIIFHCAACVRFDQTLSEAVEQNTAATHKVLELSVRMTHLQALVHVSTAYCNCHTSILEEKVYTSPHKPDVIMAMTKCLNKEVLQAMGDKMIAPQPNTYAYTKALTESLLQNYESHFPIAIARPSIVTAAWAEPIPGWITNLNGPTGLIVGAGKGVIRSMLCNDFFNADVMPVDFVINACILIAREIAMTKPKFVKVYNITESNRNPVTWGEALELGRKYVLRYPFQNILWYPGGSTKSNKVYHYLAHVFFHVLPAYIIDVGIFLAKERPFMVNVQKRVSGGLKVLQYYTTREWHFKNDNFLNLVNNICVEDKSTFCIDTRQVNWDSYMENYVKGARRYCCKESDSTLPECRKKLQRYYNMDQCVKIVLIILLICVILAMFF